MSALPFFDHDFEAEGQCLSIEQLIKEAQYEEAFQALAQLLRVKPKFGKAYAWQGWLLQFKAEEPALAEEAYRAALAFSPYYRPSYYHLMELYFQQGRRAELAELLARAQNIAGIHPGYLAAYQARLAKLEGQTAQARAAAQVWLAYAFDAQTIAQAKAFLAQI